MMRILGFRGPHNQGDDGEWAGENGCVSIEEVMLPGPNGPMPYIRRHASCGYTDFPKHNLGFICYTSD